MRDQPHGKGHCGIFPYATYTAFVPKKLSVICKGSESSAAVMAHPAATFQHTRRFPLASTINPPNIVLPTVYGLAVLNCDRGIAWLIPPFVGSMYAAGMVVSVMREYPVNVASIAVNSASVVGAAR